MRSENSIKNATNNLVIMVLTSVLSFVARTFFINILGKDFLGLDGLYTNILSMLSLADLGLSTAISFSLYEPLVKNDFNKISVLLSFFKKMYRIVALLILIFGLIILPFLKYIVNDYQMDNMYLYFLIYVISAAFSYLIAYKEVLLFADQKKYKIGFINCFFVILLYFLEIIVLYNTKSFLYYILIILIVKQTEKIFINCYITKKYPQINYNNKEKISIKEKKSIKEKIKALMFHRLGYFFLNSTDNIMISAFVDIMTVGVYTNYLSFVSVARNIIASMTQAVTSSFGNLFVTDSVEIQERTFKVIDFSSYVFIGLFSLLLFFLLNPFIALWIGTDYILNELVLLIICLNFYLYCLLQPLEVVKGGVGFYEKDRFIPLIQVIINIFFSYILSIKLGLIGILLGTLISYIFVINWTKPFYIYKYIFKMPVKKYYLKHLYYFFVILLAGICIYLVNKLFIINNLYLLLVLKVLLILIIYIVFIVLFFHNNYNYQYFMKIIINFMKKKKGL